MIAQWGIVRRFVFWLAFWSVVVGCVAAAGFVLHRGVPEQPASSVVVPVKFDQSTQKPTATALFVGDSYIGGYEGVAAADTYACKVAAALDWVCRTDAVGGTGYVSDGPRGAGTTNYAGRLALDVVGLAGQEPDWIVVTGGRNDVGHPGARKTATAYLTALATLWPDAHLVVVEPYWNDDDAPAAVEQLRSDVHAAARAVDATWVPTGTWLDPALIGPDHVHPTPAGQARIASKLTAALTRISAADR